MKTVRQLYIDFTNKFTVDQIAASPELAAIYIYLQNKVSMANGNYHHEPGLQMQKLIKKHLNYSFADAEKITA